MNIWVIAKILQTRNINNFKYNMIKTVLFDYAGVISPTKNNYIFALQNCKRFELTPKELMELSYENWTDTAIGKLKSNVYWNNIAEKLKIEPDKLRKLVISTFPVNKKVIDLIEKTHKNYTTVLFSNQIEDWLEKVIDENKIRNIFNYFVNSYNVGVRKPDRKIFIEALRITNSKPEETLLIDDSLENIKAANKLGIKTIQFNNYIQFLSQYKKYIKLANS